MRLIEKMDKDRNKKFDALVKRHRDLIWHVCADYSLSAAWEVQDAVQEVLCVLWRDFETFSGRSSERTWVYRVASNTMISLKRRQNNVPQAVLEEMADDLRVEDDENYRFLLQAIENLDDVDGQIVRAHLDGFQNQEIAAITGLSLATIGRRLLPGSVFARNMKKTGNIQICITISKYNGRDAGRHRRTTGAL